MATFNKPFGDEPMLSFETIDMLADAYNPVLFLGYLIFSVIYWRSGDRAAVLKGLAGLILAYVLMGIDNRARIWESVGLDYSTHTAVALALVIFHVHKRYWRSAAALAIATSLLVYFAVMVYQRYHTVMDIVTTAAIVAAVVATSYLLVGGACRRRG